MEILSIWELAARIGVPAKTILQLVQLPDEPMPIYDPATMRVNVPDVIAWFNARGVEVVEHRG